MSNKYKVLVVFGTRPEAIKMAPIINSLKNYSKKIEPIVCVTGQHRQMLDQVIKIFKIKVNYDLNLMTKNQSISDITEKILKNLSQIIKRENPNRLLVQGDTTTTFASSLAAFYLKVPIAHVEAGLRTWNNFSPWPEEINRKLTTSLADMHFAPTEWAKNNLLKENVPQNKIYVTGNTVIDALIETEKKITADKSITKNLESTFKFLNPKKSLILITGHRRENFGEGFKNICQGIKTISRKIKNVEIVFPVHLNPNVRKPVYNFLGANNSSFGKNIFLIEPLDYLPFVYLMKRSKLVLTDSGGIQEEAPSLGKPVLLMRDTTERPEGVLAGTSKLVGSNPTKIYQGVKSLLINPHNYEKMKKKHNPYGDGKSGNRIAKILATII